MAGFRVQTVGGIAELLQKQFESQESTDFSFSFKDGDDETILNVHSIILVANSNVFMTMINGSLKETTR